ncbi:CLUMA_CG019291, isoform A [Clunio marinus]|uniref:CLUMA_CG019291, isoform A n=1 Tax=Clunio marinus TaxID=568069 RepID=A0A1J1J0U1_9DIPT|nr:CLUMA_CG019291, isoform A [Clunio marinus]
MNQKFSVFHLRLSKVPSPYHIVNFLVKVPSQPSIFITSIDTTGITQVVDTVAADISKVIDKIGAYKFASVVTDDAPVMKVAWKHLSAFGCAAHAMNLLVKYILGPYESILSDCSAIAKFFNNHHRPLGFFDDARKSENPVIRTLIVASRTRWFSQYNFLKSVLDAR